tara:strand:+ start:11109 stop:12248 length:1140 start_codon:yes stop_codon:yes gene_type:complete
MIFLESYSGVGGGQKTLAKIAALNYRLFPNVKSYLLLTAPSKHIKELYNNCDINLINLETSSLNKFGDFRSWLSFTSLLRIFPIFFYYQLKLLYKLLFIDEKKVFLCDYRALSISLIPCILSKKKIYFYLIGGSPYNNKINRFLSKFLFRIYSISDDLAKNVEITNYKLVRNGIDVTKFSNSNQYVKSKNFTNKFVFVGTYSQNKGLHRLVFALKSSKNQNWTLDAYGTFLNDDPYELYLINLISNDKRIKLHGFTKNIHSVLSQFSTLVFPSVSYDSIIINDKEVIATSSEGSPTVIIEAIFSGLTVLANNVTGVGDLAENLPNIYSFDWDDLLSKGIQPDLIELNKLIKICSLKQNHRILFDKNKIYKELLINIHND